MEVGLQAPIFSYLMFCCRATVDQCCIYWHLSRLSIYLSLDLPFMIYATSAIVPCARRGGALEGASLSAWPISLDQPNSPESSNNLAYLTGRGLPLWIRDNGSWALRLTDPSDRSKRTPISRTHLADFWLKGNISQYKGQQGNGDRLDSLVTRE